MLKSISISDIANIIVVISAIFAFIKLVIGFVRVKIKYVDIKYSEKIGAEYKCYWSLNSMVEKRIVEGYKIYICRDGLHRYSYHVKSDENDLVLLVKKLY